MAKHAGVLETRKEQKNWKKESRKENRSLIGHFIYSMILVVCFTVYKNQIDKLFWSSHENNIERIEKNQPNYRYDRGHPMPKD